MRGTEAIRAVVKTADFVLIPVKPSPHDLRSVGSTVEIAQQEGKLFAFVVANASLTVQAMAALSAHGRVAPTVMHAANLWEFVLERLHESTKARQATSHAMGCLPTSLLQSGLPQEQKPLSSRGYGWMSS